MNIQTRNNINIVGQGQKTLLLAHGFGCDQRMWRFLIPALQEEYKLVLFDYVGSGKSDTDFYDFERYSTLHGYKQDLLEVCDALSLSQVGLVGHSVSSMIGLLAAIERPLIRRALASFS